MDFETFSKGTYWRNDKLFEVEDFGGRDMGGNTRRTPIVPSGTSIRFEGETAVVGPADLEAVLRSLLRDKTDWNSEDEKIAKRKHKIDWEGCSRCPRRTFKFESPAPSVNGLQIVNVRLSHNGYCCKC